MSITQITLPNGVAVETTDSSLVLSLLAQLVLPMPTVQEQPKAAQESVTRSKRTTAKSKAPKVKAAKQSVPKADLLAEVRRLYRDGAFDEARSIIPKGWMQVVAEVDRAEARKQAPSTQEAPKEPVQEKAKAPKTVPTGSEAPASRVTPKEMSTFVDWKNSYTAKVNDLLSVGDPDDIALGYAELLTLIDALGTAADNVDSSESGLLIAKASHLADLVGRLAPDAKVWA